MSCDIPRHWRGCWNTHTVHANKDTHNLQTASPTRFFGCCYQYAHAEIIEMCGTHLRLSFTSRPGWEPEPYINVNRTNIKQKADFTSVPVYNLCCICKTSSANFHQKTTGLCLKPLGLMLEQTIEAHMICRWRLQIIQHDFTFPSK